MRNFWHMQMHQPKSPAGIEKHILINRRVIGLDKWDTEEAGQQDAFQQKMMEGDIVAIKNGSQFIALGEWTGPILKSRMIKNLIGWSEGGKLRFWIGIDRN